MPRASRATPTATAVVLVRHGTTSTTGKVLPGRARGLHLSESGAAEAAAVAERLAGFDVAAVYSSPLERARETAAPISKAVSQPVTIERGLLECDFGEWTGQELASLSRLPEWKTVQRYPSGFRFPGGESFLELQARVQSTLDVLAERHRGETIVAVSHADCIKAMAATALGVPLDLFQRILVGPCSTTVLVLSAEGPAVLTLNSYGPPAGLRPRVASSRATPRAGRKARA